MPYLLLVLGLLLGGYALYRFFLRASIAEIKAFALSALAIILIIAIFVMAVTGRLPAALALVVALAPFVPKYFAVKKETGGGTDNPNLSHKEALDILGLKDGASPDDIRAAYKKLMKKVHPDQEGSEWMAQKLNAAKDLLLKD